MPVQRLVSSNKDMPACVRQLVEGILQEKPKDEILRDWDDARKKHPFSFVEGESLN